MRETLLHTKLHLPLTRPGLVVRPRLHEQIRQGLCGPLTLVSAPAGFGKTTLMGATLSGWAVPVAWLSLDKDDNQVERFLNYLVAALQRADHTIGSEAAGLLNTAGQAPLKVILTSLINDLDSAGEDMVLVLDDFQFISNQAVHDGLAFLLEHCPGRLHLMIATRSDPPLPVARLRARGQVVELRAADLRFTRPEAAQFLNDVMGLQLDAASIAALEERTEGWIAGLQMAAISMRDRQDVQGFIEGFTGNNRFILDYLMEEVLASRPPEIQRFLVYTSILNRLTAPLCDFILALNEISDLDQEPGLETQTRSFPDSASVLNYLERANLFLVPLDDERTWYRYHHLFNDLLCARLLKTQPALVPLLHREASAWLEREGFFAEAIHHLLAAQEIDQAADRIQSYGPRLLAESDPAVLQMADELPQETILSRPKLGLYQAWFLITQGRIGRALPLLKGMKREISQSQLIWGEPWMETVVASALVFLDPHPNMDHLPEYQLLDEIPPQEPILRNAADYLYGMALGRAGNLDEAIQVSLKSVQREKNAYRNQAIPTLAPLLSRLYLMQGRLHAAASLCREFLDPIREKGIRTIHTAGSMKIDLGEVLYEWNHLEEAEQQIREGLRDNESWHNIMTDGFGLVALARVLKAKGDYSGAMQVVEKFETRLQEHAQPREFDEDLRTLKVRVQLAGGDLRNPSQWADQNLLGEEYDRIDERFRLLLGHIRLAEGKFAAVERMLDGITPPPAVGSHISRRIESNLLLAAAIAGQQRQPEAFGLIESCLALAEPEGYIRIFLDFGEPVRDLLAAYLRSDAPRHKHYARKLIDAFSLTSLSPSPEVQTAVLLEPLTERELEVLELLALGKTNKEIAQQLFVAPGTVKAHTASIYRKLDVTNRTEAASYAREIGILS